MIYKKIAKGLKTSIASTITSYKKHNNLHETSTAENSAATSLKYRTFAA